MRQLLLRAQLQRVVKGLGVADPLSDAGEVRVHATRLRLINLDLVDHRERRQVRISNSQQVYAARSRVARAYYPIAGKRPLDVQIELQIVGILKIVIGGLQLVFHVKRIEVCQQVGKWDRRRRGRERGALGERWIQAAGGEIIFGQQLVVEDPEAGKDRCLSAPKSVPGNPDAWSEALERWIGVPWVAHGLR